MTRSPWRILPVALALSVLVSMLAVAGPAAMVAEGSASGKAILRFAGSQTTAALSGSVNLAGSWVEGTRAVSFVARGTILGLGYWNLSTLSGTAWATFLAWGTEGQTEPVEIRGALCIASAGAQRSGPGAVEFAGRCILVLRRPSGDVAFIGVVSGRMSGGFVVPEVKYTMQAEGTLVLDLHGEPSVSPLLGLDAKSISTSPWEDSLWPDEASRRLLVALGWSPAPPGTAPSARK